MNRYYLNQSGDVIAFGQMNEGNVITGEEPFNMRNFDKWRKKQNNQ